MSGKCFLDTNIFVYSFDGSAPAKRERALGLIREAVATGAGVVSYQVVQEFFNVALRRFARPMSPDEAQQYLMTVFRPLLAVESSLNLWQHGLYIRSRFNLSWFDSLIVAAAIEARCDVLYTEDLQDGLEIEGLRVENPFL
jgi:predicted nucleic acid-binding protein